MNTTVLHNSSKTLHPFAMAVPPITFLSIIVMYFILLLLKRNLLAFMAVEGEGMNRRTVAEPIPFIY